MVSMLENADKSINIDYNSWTNVKAKNISAYVKSKTLLKEVHGISSTTRMKKILCSYL